MLKRSVLVLAIGMAGLVSGCARGPEAPVAATAAVSDAAAREAHEEANRQLAMKFFREGITSDEQYELMHPDYIQHNPTFKKFGELNKAKGREEYRLLTRNPDKFPAPPEAAPDPNRPKGDPLYLVTADRDVVTVLQKSYRKDPLNPGKYYETFWFDSWRVKDGKLYEHWDASNIDPKNIPEILRTPIADMH